MNKAINIYQIFTRLFRNDIKSNKKFGTKEENGCSVFNDFSDNALQELRTLGATHIWYTGVIRHTTTTDYTYYGIPYLNPRVIKGRAGSPYAIIDYYDVDPDLATDVDMRMQEFEALIERTHNNGMKCIIDFVPNHVGREYNSLKHPEGIKNFGQDDDTSKAFDPNNNFYYIPNQQLQEPGGINFPYTENSDPYYEFPAKVTGNDSFSNTPSINDWYETIKLNYGVNYQNHWTQHFYPIPNTWEKMKEILLFWTTKGVDGFRCDMAEMVPVEFWGWVIPKIKEVNPEILFIAEVYNPQEYRNYLHKGKFDYLYDKVGLYDILRLIIEGHGSAKYISDYWKTIDGIEDNMLRFLENHDEQRIASPQFAGDAWAGIPAWILSCTMNTGPTMLYFGQEIGEPAIDEEGFSGKDGRTSIFDYWHVTEFQKWVNRGSFDTKSISGIQKHLRDFYKKIWDIRLQSDAICNGDFFDIMYENYKGNLNADRIYAFIRHSSEQKLLMVINFDRYQTQNFKLRIPEHAADVCGLDKHKLYQARDILFGIHMCVISIQEAITDGIDFTLEPNTGYILELQ